MACAHMAKAEFVALTDEYLRAFVTEQDGVAHDREMLTVGRPFSVIRSIHDERRYGQDGERARKPESPSFPAFPACNQNCQYKRDAGEEIHTVVTEISRHNALERMAT